MVDWCRNPSICRARASQLSQYLSPSARWQFWAPMQLEFAGVMVAHHIARLVGEGLASIHPFLVTLLLAGATPAPAGCRASATKAASSFTVFINSTECLPPVTVDHKHPVSDLTASAQLQFQHLLAPEYRNHNSGCSVRSTRIRRTGLIGRSATKRPIVRSLQWRSTFAARTSSGLQQIGLLRQATRQRSDRQPLHDDRENDDHVGRCQDDRAPLAGR